LMDRIPACRFQPVFAPLTRVLLTAGLVAALLWIVAPRDAQPWRAPQPAPLGPIAPGDPPAAPSAPDIFTTQAEQDLPACAAARACLFLPLAGNKVNTARQSARDLYLHVYLALDAPIQWSGSVSACDPGTTSQSFRDSVLRRVNYFRIMAGVPALEGFADTYNQLDQAAALMMSANDDLSHDPPDDWKCYTQAGAEGAGSSNLYLGVYGPAAISGYMRDPGSGNAAAGHRRWILYPNNRSTGTGDLPPTAGYSSANALRAWDDYGWEPRPQTREEFVAWPPPGYVPYPVVYPRWSFSYPAADFDHAAVKVWRDGSAVSLHRYTPEDGYGENTLVWIMDGMSEWQNWPRPGYDQVYMVEISNVIVAGLPRNFTYGVIIFDPAN